MNVGVHSCLRIISSSLVLSLPPPPFRPSSRRSSCAFSPRASLFPPRSRFSAPSFSRPPSTDHVREGILFFFFIPHPDPLSWMARNDCFTPPLARELGNKLAVGLISLSLPMGEMGPHPTLKTSRPDVGGPRPNAEPEDTVEIVSRHTTGSMVLHARSAVSLKTGQSRLKRRRRGKLRR